MATRCGWGRWFVLALVSFGLGSCSSKKSEPASPGSGGSGGGVATTPPSSDELISQALESGTIDDKTASLLYVISAWAPERLPDPYWSKEPRHSFASFGAQRLAFASKASYDADSAALLDAILASPEDPNWLVFPESYPVRHAGETASICASWYGVTKTGNPPDARYLGPSVPTKYFRIRAILPSKVTVAQQQDIEDRMNKGLAASVPGVGGTAAVPFTTYLDQVYEYFWITKGMIDPISVYLPAAQADKRIPIYIGTCDGTLNDAMTSGAGYIFASVGLALEDPDLRRVVLPHEINHLFANAYQAPPVGPDLEWPYEAFAVFSEDSIAPDVKRWSGKYASSPNAAPKTLSPMNRSFRCPEEKFHTSSAGACENRPAGETAYRGDYSKFVYFKFAAKAGYLGGWDTFFKDLLAAKDDPRGLTKYFPPEAMNRFQMGLLADYVGFEAFDAADRAVFFDPNQKSLDLGTNDPARYTFKLEAQKLESASKALRLAPTTKASSAALSQPDASSLPIQPSATHRLLLEAPLTASSETDAMGPAPSVKFLIKFSGGAHTLYVAPTSGMGAGPPRSFDDTWWVSDNGTPTTKDVEDFYIDMAGTGLPGYVMLTITNASNAPLSYRVGATFPSPCFKRCVDYYADKLLKDGCPDKWCASSTGDQKQTCIDNFEQNMRAVVDGSLAPVSLCWTGCTNYPLTLADPPNDTGIGPVSWGKLFCSNGGSSSCSSDPMALVAIPDWPAVQCSDVY